MKKLILIGLLIGTLSVMAADFTISLPARLVTVSQKVCDRLTIQRGTNVSIQVYLMELVGTDLAQRKAEQDADDVGPIREAWQTATPATKAQVKTLLGIP